MSGEPPEGIAPPFASAAPLAPADVDDHDEVVSTERMPRAFPVDSMAAEAPPDVNSFFSPPPPPPGDRVSEVPPSSSQSARRRSRRTVKVPVEAAPAPVAIDLTASGPTTKAAPAAIRAPAQAEDEDDHRVTAQRASATTAATERPRSEKLRAQAPRPVIPATPPVPSMPPARSAPTLRAVPRPAPTSKPPVVEEPPPPEVLPPPPPVYVSPAAPIPIAPAASASPPSDEAFDVIRPMRIINIGTSAPPPPPMASEPPPAAHALADGTSQPSPGGSPRVSRPPKPPVVEEVDAIEEIDEPSADTQPTVAPSAAGRHDDVETIPLDDEVDAVDTERLSDSDLGSHTDDEVPVDLDEPRPKKPPPPPPKRSTSMEPPANPPAGAADAQKAPAPAVSAPPPAASAAASSAPPPSLDAANRKRIKPWWEEIFGDDFLRTLEKVDPRVIRKECDFIEDRLGLETGAVMLDLACGSGDHAVELAARGYNVVGYDLSLAMLARAQDEAQERKQKINFLQGDMREMAFDEAFDGMYSWSTSFGYFDDEKNVDVLQRVHKGLRQGGIFLLDVINRDYVCPRQPSLVWFEGEGCVCMDEMHVDFFTSRLRVKRTVMFDDGRSRECEYSIRLYGLHELGKMLHDTGFKVLEVTGHPAHPGVFFGSESPRIIILAERG